MFGSLIKMHASKAYDKMIKEKLLKITNQPVFWNQESKAYVIITELGGYTYFSFVITGPQEINTSVGITMRFESENESFELKSESEIVEGAHSPVSRIGITEFDVDFDQAFVDFIEHNQVNTIYLNTKNGQFLKESLSIKFDQTDRAYFLQCIRS